MIKRHFRKFWQPRGTKLPPVVVRMPDGTLKLIEPVDLIRWAEDMLQSWDCSFKGQATSDYVVGQLWARSRGVLFAGIAPGALGLPGHAQGGP